MQSWYRRKPYCRCNAAILVRESYVLCHIRWLAGLAFILLAVQGTNPATPAFAAPPKAAAAAAKPPTVPTQRWEGYWAKTRKECRYSDGPDSKTMIDLRNSENGRSAPLYDQYENHCRIDSHATKGDVTTLKLTCFEFWDDYRAKKNPRRDTVTVTVLDQGRIRIDGASYIRCRK